MFKIVFEKNVYLLFNIDICYGESKGNILKQVQGTSSETHLNRTLNKLESFINQAFNTIPMEEIFVNLICVY
jgi:hypothetical protein